MSSSFTTINSHLNRGIGLFLLLIFYSLPCHGGEATSSQPLADIQGNKIFSFVSTDCPVSMVNTVISARRLVRQDSSASVLVVHLEKLSEQHLKLHRIVSQNNLYFINDESWREKHLTERIQLPYSQTLHR